MVGHGCRKKIGALGCNSYHKKDMTRSNCICSQAYARKGLQMVITAASSEKRSGVKDFKLSTNRFKGAAPSLFLAVSNSGDDGAAASVLGLWLLAKSTMLLLWITVTERHTCWQQKQILSSPGKVLICSEDGCRTVLPHMIHNSLWCRVIYLFLQLCSECDKNKKRVRDATEDYVPTAALANRFFGRLHGPCGHSAHT